MKKHIYFYFAIFFAVNCFSQNINWASHRFSERPAQFVKVNNKFFFNSVTDTISFVFPCHLYGVSGNNTIFTKDVLFNEATVINDMIVTSDKQIAFVGTAHGCDNPGNPTFFFLKIDTLGNSIFTNNIVVTPNNFSNGQQKVIEYTDSSFFAVTDTTLYHFSKGGNLLSAKHMPLYNITAMCLKNNHLLLSTSVQSSTTTINHLSEIDTACNLVNQTTTAYSFTKLNCINSNCIIGLTSSGIVCKINAALAISANTQSAQSNYTLTDFSLSQDTIYCSAYNTLNQLSVFKIDTTFINSNLLPSPYTSTIPTKIATDNSSLYFYNIEDSLNNHNPNISVLQMSKAAGTMNITQDVGVTNSVIDSGYVTINTTSSQVNYFTYYYRMKVTVQNFGTTTVNACYINNKPYNPLICGVWYYSQYFSGLNLAPGQTATLTTSFIEYAGPVTFGALTTASYSVDINNACFWTSAPDKQSDANHTNDSYCANISYVSTVGIQNFANQQTTISYYPNPFTNSFTIHADNNIITAVDVCSVDGKLIKQLSNLNAQKATIALPDVASGFYFLKVVLQSGQTQTFKTIKN